MPRAKYEPSPYSLIYNEIGYFKKEFPDYLCDFKLIYKDLIKYYRKTCPAYSEIQNKMSLLENISEKVTHSNRIYILTEYASVVLAVVDFDEYAVNNLANIYQLLDDFSSYDDTSEYNSRLYVFKGKKMLVHTNLSTYQLAQFMAVFKTENLVNYQGARDELYGRPRREKTQLII